MKKLLALVILLSIGFVGYRLYLSSRSPSASLIPNQATANKLSQPDVASSLNVLGQTTSSLIAQGTSLLNRATNGQAEPVINQVVRDLQARVQNLPEQEYKRVKAEFCRDVFPSPFASETP